MLNLVIFGAPGSGKGTQSELIARMGEQGSGKGIVAYSGIPACTE